jgi:hypothetical protein
MFHQYTSPQVGDAWAQVPPEVRPQVTHTAAGLLGALVVFNIEQARLYDEREKRRALQNQVSALLRVSQRIRGSGGRGGTGDKEEREAPVAAAAVTP